MPVELSDRAKEFIEGKNFANLATLMPDGSPHCAPVWIDRDGNDVLINSDERRQKMKNIRRDPRVAIDIMKSDNPYDMIALRGRVVELKHDGAKEHIDKLSKKYTGQDVYQLHQPGEQRVIVRIRPDWISGRG
jgi:PPOX class probable F420-dependent enzyme